MDFKQEILNIINETIGGEVIAPLIVYYNEHMDAWVLELQIHPDKPLTMLQQGSNYESFKEFIVNEFKTRKLEGVTHWKIEQ